MRLIEIVADAGGNALVLIVFGVMCAGAAVSALTLDEVQQQP